MATYFCSNACCLHPWLFITTTHRHHTMMLFVVYISRFCFDLRKKSQVKYISHLYTIYLCRSTPSAVLDDAKQPSSKKIIAMASVFDVIADWMHVKSILPFQTISSLLSMVCFLIFVDFRREKAVCLPLHRFNLFNKQNHLMWIEYLCDWNYWL